MRASTIAALTFASSLLVVVCGTSPPDPEGPPQGDPARRGRGATGEAPSRPTANAEPPFAAEPPVGEPSAPEPSPAPCPDDMAYVDTLYCTDIERRCIVIEHEKANHLPICHAYAHEQRCRAPERRIAFCIDRYEYPNRKGAHPVWMLDWYEAQATCASKGKRLCWASEWTAACEGPNHTPFPYGWERDHDRCNMDNFFIDPKKFGPKGPFYFYSRDPQIRAKELGRLDQSVPSGSMPSCANDFGVYDMPGNFDEWVTSDIAPREISRWAGLKGGAWGHVRSQCRPMTFSHDPGFAYYFVGFRCCQDASGVAPWQPSEDAVPAPHVAPHDFAPDPIDSPAAAGPSPVKFRWVKPREAVSPGRVEPTRMAPDPAVAPPGRPAR